MKRVDAREFAAHAAEYLAAGEPLDIEKDGRVIGQYRPAPSVQTATDAASPPNVHTQNGTASKAATDRVRPESREAIASLDALLEEIYARTGLTEEEVASYFDMTKPFPLDAPTARTSH